jgi:hypothetical protein
MMRGSCTWWRAAALAAALTSIGGGEIAAAGAGTGAAQDVPARPERPGGRARGVRPPNPDTMSVQQVEKYFDQFVLVQAQTRLELTDPQFLKFGAALRQLQGARRMQQRRRMQILRDINGMLAAAEPDDTQLAARIRELDDLNADTSRRIQEAYAAIDTTLTLRQRARFRVFEENMERRKLDLLTRARAQADAPGPR